MSNNNKKSVNEGLFGGIRKFTDAFFDGLKDNTVNAALEKAKQNKLPADILDSLERIEAERKRLDNIIKKYSK